MRSSEEIKEEKHKVTYSFCCVDEDDDTIWDSDAGRDLVGEVNVAFEGDTRRYITSCRTLSELTFMD